MTLSAILAQNFPTFLGWAAGQAAKLFLGEKAKAYLKARGQLGGYETALKDALEEFGRSHPDLVASFFDSHFLRESVSDEMLKLLTREDRPSVDAIVAAYERQFRGRSFREIPAAVRHFLDLVERHLKRQGALQGLLTDRQTDESNRILRSIEQSWPDVRQSFARESRRAEDQIDASALPEAFKAASRDVLEWPQLVDGKRWIDRHELPELVQRISTNEQSVTLLIGPPGSGKSALLARLATEALAKGWPVLAIKADQLPEQTNTLEALRNHLGLPGPIQQCVQAAAQHSKVVIILDQLDALSELIDLKTERLRVLLRIVSVFRDCKNVHLIASCRTFDRNYDKRLSSIDAEELKLELPDWAAVQGVLKEHGIDATQWPSLFRELLRIPQCLKLFLRHFTGTSERLVFDSYQSMLEHLWDSRVLSGPGAHDTAGLLHDIATEMAEREVMFVPAARFDARRKALTHAVHTGILQYDASGRQLSFTHQTIFDFARARAFIANEQSLCRYVLERQSGLFVRPKLWSALHYLRASDPKAYHSELKAIWSAQNLRAHIRVLLIDFIGMQEEPSTEEIALLRPLFKGSEYTPQVLAAIAGKKAWFELLDQGYLARAMSNSDLAWPANRVLEMAWVFASARVLELLRGEWLPVPDRHSLLWQCLRTARQWDRETLSLALHLVRTGNVHNSAVHDLGSIISSRAPDLAAELVGAHFEKQIALASARRESPKVPAPDATYEELLAAKIDQDNKDQLKKFLEGGNMDWYDLPAIAEAAPRSYLLHAWPAVRSAIEVIARESGGLAATYQPDYMMATHMEIGGEREGREHPVVDSFVYAIKQLGRQDISGLREFVSSNEDSQSLTVHRLLCLGLCEGAKDDPLLCLDYLMRDVRRLSLGNFHEDERETKLLLRALIPHLTAENLIQLERYILAANAYANSEVRQDPKNRLTLAKYNRQFQLRLLLQFPRGSLSKGTQSLIVTELRAFPEFKDERREVEAHWSRSPMKADAMAKASPDTIRSFLGAFPDSTGWGGAFRGHGGSVEVSREFAAFAKKEPAKAIAIMLTLDPTTQQRPAAYAIRELSRDEIPDDDLITLIADMDARGFSGDDFRECAADALRKRVETPSGLPDSAIDLLERWLDEQSLGEEGSSGARDPRPDGEESRPGRSVLWSMGGARILPTGSYQLLNAVFFGLLARTPTPSDRLLQVLRKHLARNDAIEVWDAIAADGLTRLRYCDHSDAARFLDELFGVYPDLMGSMSASVLLAHSLNWAPQEHAQRWLAQLQRSESAFAKQSFGELLVLRHTFVAEQWSRNAIHEVIEKSSSPTGGSMNELVGLVYAAANLWGDAKERLVLKQILKAGMDSPDARVANAAMDWFRRGKRLELTQETRSVLEAFARGRSLEAATDRALVLDRLTDLIDEAPDLVYQVCVRLLDLFKADLNNLGSGSAMHSEDLLSIALTLQRQEEPHRTRGLDLFEQLLSQNAYRAREVLLDIDRRPGAAVSAEELRPRRRRRRKTSA